MSDDEVSSRFVSLTAQRILLMTRMEAMREDGAPIDNQALLANIANTVELVREHGRRQTDHDGPIHLYLAEP